VTFAIRLAEPSEYIRVGELTVEAYTADGLSSVETDYVHQLRDAASRAEKAELWVAVDDGGQVLGSVTFSPPGSPYREIGQEGEGEFRMLAVDPAAQGSGIGTALVRWCMDRSRELGLPRLVLCTQVENATAIGMYERLGFVRLPERDWSPAANVDLISYTLDL
jgi:ribosomal protein S18 acetylase RimI-like enzyme